MTRAKSHGFSLVEVLVSVLIITSVGVGMSALNSLVVRLGSEAQLKTLADGLNQESLAVASEIKQEQGGNFASYLSGLGCPASGSCLVYVDCPVQPIDANCSLASQPASVQLEPAKLKMIRKLTIIIQENPTSYLATAATSWGRTTFYRAAQGL